MITDIFITLFLVFLNGFFVASEFAIVKVRSSQIELRIRAGSKLAKRAKHMTENLDSYLSATQLGITLASLGLGWIGESVVSEIIENIFVILGMSISSETLHQISLPAAFLTITVLHIVFGELAPKSMAIQKPESISLIIALPLKAFYFVFKPFIWTLNSFANIIIRIIGFVPQNKETEFHSSEELLYLFEESSKSGVEGIPDKQLIENVFDFSKIPIKQIMVPRGRITGIDIHFKIDDIIEQIIKSGFSRLPVYEDEIDNIIGVIYAKDLLNKFYQNDDKTVEDTIRKAYFVKEDEKIDKLLRDMQKHKVHLAVVIDEFGGTAGIVTLEDIIEEIVGEIQDEYDKEPPIIIKISENVFKVQAITVIDDANDFLPIPLPNNDDYETIAGLIINMVGRIPQKEEIVELDNYSCLILNSSDRNIEMVQLTLK